MKGLALILGGPKKPSPFGGSSKPPMGPPSAEPDSDDAGGAPDSDADDSGSDSTETKYAKLASEAIADGDHEAAADALVSLVKSCVSSYGPK